MAGEGFANVLDQCLAVRPGEQVVLLTDGGTDQQVVTRLLEAVATRDGVPLVAQMPMPYLPGAEPPGAVAAMMLEAGAVIELTSLFIGSSRARRNATDRLLPGGYSPISKICPLKFENALWKIGSRFGKSTVLPFGMASTWG